MGSYRVLPDVAIADVALEIDGEGLDDLFATAARALAELTVDPTTLAGAATQEVALEADALDLLLFDWLAELIFRKDRDRAVFPAADVRVTPGPPCRLAARVAGGTIDRGRTTLRADPKAVTFHRFGLDALPAGRWRATVVIDV